MRTVTRAEIVAQIGARSGLPRAESARVVEALLYLMKAAFDQDRSLKIAGFGTFQLRIKAARWGRNPQTAERMIIAPRRVLTFKPSALLRMRLGDESGDPGDGGSGRA